MKVDLVLQELRVVVNNLEWVEICLKGFNLLLKTLLLLKVSEGKAGVIRLSELLD